MLIIRNSASTINGLLVITVNRAGIDDFLLSVSAGWAGEKASSAKDMLAFAMAQIVGLWGLKFIPHHDVNLLSITCC